jgi:hypothetical protein
MSYSRSIELTPRIRDRLLSLRVDEAFDITTSVRTITIPRSRDADKCMRYLGRALAWCALNRGQQEEQAQGQGQAARKITVYAGKLRFSHTSCDG